MLLPFQTLFLLNPSSSPLPQHPELLSHTLAPSKQQHLLSFLVPKQIRHQSNSFSRSSTKTYQQFLSLQIARRRNGAVPCTPRPAAADQPSASHQTDGPRVLEEIARLHPRSNIGSSSSHSDNNASVYRRRLLRTDRSSRRLPPGASSGREPPPGRPPVLAPHSAHPPGLERPGLDAAHPRHPRVQHLAAAPLPPEPPAPPPPAALLRRDRHRPRRRAEVAQGGAAAGGGAREAGPTRAEDAVDHVPTRAVRPRRRVARGKREYALALVRSFS
jgi:hypothetical protein